MIHDYIYRYVCILNILKTRDSIANDRVFTRLASLRVGFGHKRYSLWTMGIKIWIRYFHMKSLIQLIYQPVFFIHRHCFCWHCTKKWGTDCSHSAWGSGMNRVIYLLEIDLLFSENTCCWNVPSTVNHAFTAKSFWSDGCSKSLFQFQSLFGGQQGDMCVCGTNFHRLFMDTPIKGLRLVSSISYIYIYIMYIYIYIIHIIKHVCIYVIYAYILCIYIHIYLHLVEINARS